MNSEMLICSCCKANKPVSEFNKRKERPRGYKSHCKSCFRKKYYLKRTISDEDRIQMNASARQNYQKHKEKISERNKEYYNEYPDRKKATNIISHAIRDKKILRPNICSQCKIECIPDAHHEDYSKPLEVIWLCRKCHKKLHRGDKSYEPKRNNS